MTLDLIDGIELSETQCARHANALGTLQRLAVGLGYLYSNVRAVERRVQQDCRETHGSDTVTIVYGHNPHLSPGEQMVLESMAQWYSVSICSFVQIVSCLAYDNQSELRRKYISVLGPIKAFRDKIGAHFAGGTANAKDDESERLASLIPQLTWIGDRFRMATWTVRIARGAEVRQSDELSPWSLTDQHHAFCKRFPLLRDHTPNLDEHGLLPVVDPASRPVITIDGGGE